MSQTKVFFSDVKEDRGWYFVEYSPPMEGYPLAYVHLTIPESADKAKIVEAMETEMRIWLNRYPIPVEVQAWDGNENPISLAPIKESKSLFGYFPKGQQEIHHRWAPVGWQELPQVSLDRTYLKTVYADIPFRTSEDLQRQAKKHSRMVLTVWWFFFVWAVVVPLIVIILGETNVWVARLVLGYSLWKVVVEILKRTGKWKKSARQIQREKEDLERDHHHYHCKRNPEAFARLKSENFDRETRERIRKEAETLKLKS